MPRIELSVATPADREVIYAVRHEIYARELAQHSLNQAARLRDALDDWNIYLVARVAGEIAGFVSITPPQAPAFSIDKYFARDTLPFSFNDQLYEVRLLTVLKPLRGRELATLLMYAAFRWVEAHGGTSIVAIGRHEILDLYLRVGLEPVGLDTNSGAVRFDLLLATLDGLRRKMLSFTGVLLRLEEKTDWQLMFPFRRPAVCFHGGAFFKSVGEQFDGLERGAAVINADVLDAWFPPAPGVRQTLQTHLPWLLRTSPPTACEGLIQTVARARGVQPDNILAGAGSSDLIFRALPHWLTPASHALILDPTYGEYAHVLERVVGCTVDRLTLNRTARYDLDLARLEVALRDDYDLVVLVNPNSPTGRHASRSALEKVLQTAPGRTRIWLDETYVDYAPAEQSLERFAARSENVIVCKSMSKVYALSGARVAYLCAGPHQLEALRAITPPWVVSLPAQVAAVRALEAPEYYAALYSQTHLLREALAAALRALEWEVTPGMANFLLCHLPDKAPEAAALVAACRERNLFLRDAAQMGSSLGPRAVRIAVKDAATQERMLRIIREVWARIGG